MRPGADDLVGADRTDAGLRDENGSERIHQACQLFLTLSSFDLQGLRSSGDRAQGLGRDLKLEILVGLSSQLRASSHQSLSTHAPQPAAQHLRRANHQRVQLTERLCPRLEGSLPS